MPDTTPAPISELPLAYQERIAALVAQPCPPPKYLTGEIDGRPMFQIRSRAWLEWYRQRGIDPNRRREKIPKAVREKIIERDGLVCQLCGGDVDPDDLHLDHVHPRSLGGSNHETNLQVAHSVCNMRKGASVE